MTFVFIYIRDRECYRGGQVLETRSNANLAVSEGRYPNLFVRFTKTEEAGPVNEIAGPQTIIIRRLDLVGPGHCTGRGRRIKAEFQRL